MCDRVLGGARSGSLFPQSGCLSGAESAVYEEQMDCSGDNEGHVEGSLLASGAVNAYMGTSSLYIWIPKTTGIMMISRHKKQLLNGFL